MKKHQQREAPPPGWYGQSKSGRYFRLCRTKYSMVDGDLRTHKQYRLEFYNPDFSSPLKGNGLWTLEQLREQGVRFLQNRPSCAPKDGARPPIRKRSV